jgi:hypothetical protein
MPHPDPTDHNCSNLWEYSPVAPGTLRRWTYILVGTSCLFGMAGTSLAQSPNIDDLEKLRRELIKEQAQLKQQEEKIKQQEEEIVRQTLHLNAQAQLLNSELKKLRGAGPTGGAAEAPSTSTSEPDQQNQAQGTETPAPVGQVQTAQSSGTGQSSGADQSSGTAQTAPGTAPAESAPITGPSQKEEAARRTLQTASNLQSTGGVLTPRGVLSLEPSLEYDYWNSNQLSLNGFEIIPGITFGNFFISKVQQNILTAAMTARLGVTDRLELNVKIPYVYNYAQWTAQEAGPNAQFLYTDASNHAIGDVQFGASYQFNSGNNGWPIFVGNLIWKTATGVSPFSVPVITVNEPNGQFLEGIPTKTATGTGFNALEPSLSILYPTAPGVWFANFLYIHNFARTFDVPTPAGGPPVSENLNPGSAIAATFGIGFALNDRTSLTLSYQQEHYFTSSENGSTIPGSSYDFGTFNFGIGYQVNKSTSINIGVGIGAGPNAPAAKILVTVPIHLNVF